MIESTDQSNSFTIRMEEDLFGASKRQVLLVSFLTFLFAFGFSGHFLTYPLVFSTSGCFARASE